MKTKRLLLFPVIILFLGTACGLFTPFWSGSVAGPIEQTQTPILETGSRNFNHGELIILYDQASITTANEGWFKPQFGCWPTSYYDDGGGYLRLSYQFNQPGEIMGYCSWTSPSDLNPSVTWNTRGNLQGVVDDDNKVSFEFDTQANYFVNTVDIKFIGGGTIKGEHAEGNATFTATCHSNGPENNCNNMTTGGEMVSRNSWQIKGTVPWTMDFTP